MTWLVAVLVALLLLVLAAAVAVAVGLATWGGTDPTEAAPSQQSPATGNRPGASVTGDPASSGTPDTASSTPQTSRCPALVASQTIPTAAPPDGSWELVGRVAAPTAPEVHGPGITTPVRSCFARSPTGALYAAVNILATTTLPDGPDILTGPLAAAGPGRDAAVQRLSTEGPTRPSATTTQVAGFAFYSYTPETTTIDLAILATSPEASGLAHVPLTLRWQPTAEDTDATGSATDANGAPVDGAGGTGDWVVVYPDSGDLFAGIGSIPSLVGYVAWSGT